MHNKTPPIICIAGPTAVGKTNLAIALAKRYNGEIISADSMQIYRKMDIGTAKPTLTQRQGIAHHLLDVVDIGESYSAGTYQRDARNAIDDVQSRGKLPILCGGTGLYIHAAFYNMQFANTQPNPQLRASLQAQAQEDPVMLFETLRQVDAVTAEKLHINDTKRIVRALEIFYATGQPMSAQVTDYTAQSVYPFVYMGLTTAREVLYARINQRVEQMMQDGFLEEVQMLRELYAQKLYQMQAIGYKELLKALDGEYSVADAVEQIQQNSRRYAKRQLTWFNRERNIVFFDIMQENFLEKVYNHIDEL